MKLKPLHDRLIVKAVEEEETTASGIVLPDTAKEKPQRGKVLAAVAASEASRPQRRDRDRRDQSKTGHDVHSAAASDWFGIGPGPDGE